jgi:hypothetical protein
MDHRPGARRASGETATARARLRCRCRPPPSNQTPSKSRVGQTATARVGPTSGAAPNARAGAAPAFLLVTATGQDASSAEAVEASWRVGRRSLPCLAPGRRRVASNRPSASSRRVPRGSSRAAPAGVFCLGGRAASESRTPQLRTRPRRAEESVRPWVLRIQTSGFGGSPVEKWRRVTLPQVRATRPAPAC